uniref:Telomere-associated protein Rif1 N-terminal domain-containing protein n=1 Tax=Trichuris muris TaxID=70415 RepID=A0A5S6Q0K5_TRIMR
MAGKAADKVAAQLVSDLTSSNADVRINSVNSLHMVIKDQCSLGLFTLDSSDLQLLAAGLLNVIKHDESTTLTVYKAFQCLLDSCMECTWPSAMQEIVNAAMPSSRLTALLERFFSDQFSEYSGETWSCIALLALKLALDCDISVGKCGLKFMRCINSSKCLLSKNAQFVGAALLILESSAPLLGTEHGFHLIAVCSCLLQSYFDSVSFYGNSLVVSFAKAMAPIFSSMDARLQIAAFSLWDQLVQVVDIAQDELRGDESIVQLMKPYLQVKFHGHNDRLAKLKSWWNLLLRIRDRLEDHFDTVCYPFLKFCLEADDAESTISYESATIGYLPEVLANFLLVSPSDYFDFPRLAPLTLPCFSKIATVAAHANIVLEALSSVSYLCDDDKKDFVSACWVTVFDCIGATRVAIPEETYWILCERCALFFGQFLQKCKIHIDELTALLDLLTPRYIHFPPMRLALVEDKQCVVSSIALYFISIILSKDRVCSSDLIRKQGFKDWLNTHLDQVVKLIELDDSAAQWLACFYKEASVLLSEDYCVALYFSWRSIVASLLQNWIAIGNEATSKLWLWLSYIFKYAPDLKQEVELKCVFDDWTLLLDMCPSALFESLCIRLIDVADFSLRFHSSHQSATFFLCCARMLCILVNKFSIYGTGIFKWPSPKDSSKTLSQEGGHATLRFYCFLVRVFVTELQQKKRTVSTCDEATIIALFEFMKDVCSTVRHPDEIVAVCKHLTAPISQLLDISDSFVEFSKRSLHEQVHLYLQVSLGTVKKLCRGQFDSAFLKIIAHLLTSLLCHSYMNLRRLAIRFWQETFRDYPLTLPCLGQLKDALERSMSFGDLGDSSPEIEWSTSTASASLPIASRRQRSANTSFDPSAGNKTRASVIVKKRLKGVQHVSSKRRYIVSRSSRHKLVDVRRLLFPVRDSSENSPVFIALPSPAKLPLVTRMPCASNTNVETRNSAPLLAITPSDEDIFKSNAVTETNIEGASKRLPQCLLNFTDLQTVEAQKGSKFYRDSCIGELFSGTGQGNSNSDGRLLHVSSTTHSPRCPREQPSTRNSLHQLMDPTCAPPRSSSGALTQEAISWTSPVQLERCDIAGSLFPELSNCSETVDVLVPLLTSSTCCPGLRKVLNECGIHTIGDFARLSAYAVQQFPIKGPKVSRAKSALRRLYTLSGAADVTSCNTVFEEASHYTRRTNESSILTLETIKSLRDNIKQVSHILETCQRAQSVGVFLSAAEILEDCAKDLIRGVRRHLAK